MDIQAAVARLNSQLPLKARQTKLPHILQMLHQDILCSFIERGRAPTQSELKAQFHGLDVEESLGKLGEADLIVLDKKGDFPVGAYPVTNEKTAHQVVVNGHTIHAMCALDALSVAPMFDEEAVITSACHLSKTLIRILMQGNAILSASPENAVVGIRWQMPASVAAHSMCMEMVFLKDMQTGVAWQAGDTESISLFTLPDAVAFGKAFFLPLME